MGDSESERAYPHLHLADRRLEVTGDEFQQLVQTAARHLAQHLDTLSDQPAWSTDGGEQLARSVAEPLPETGEGDFDHLIGRVVHELTSVSFNTASPGYLAFVPGGGTPHSAIADLVAATINRFVTVWVAAPALAQIENTVVRWFADVLGLPETASGYLTSGGSMATWSAVVTARRTRLPDDFFDGCIYASDQAHHCVQKAAVLAGFPARNVRIIPTDDQCRIQTSALAEQVALDFEAGLRPFMVIANAGTTNTGAIDDLNAIADLCDEQRLWLHIDAAYGGFFALTERGKSRMSGIERADSITLDPHKGLFMPYGLGCLLVRRLEDLRQTHFVDGDYMPAMQQGDEFVDISTISPELSRGFRGLRAWLPLKLFGASAFRDLLEEKLDLTGWAYEQLQEIEGVDVISPPELTTIAFRFVKDGLDDKALDALNRQGLERINEPKRIYLTPTVIQGRFVIRICIISFRTHIAEVEYCVERIREVAAGL